MHEDVHMEVNKGTQGCIRMHEDADGRVQVDLLGIRDGHLVRFGAS